MKFARAFKDALARGEYPEAWVEAAIPYGVLKKCVKAFLRELEELGLDPDTLRQLLAAETTPARGSLPLAKYNLHVNDSETMQPRFTVLVDFDDGVAVDASLSESSKAFLRRLAAKGDAAERGNDVGPSSPDTSSVAVASGSSAHLARVEVPLKFDDDFFRLIQQDIASLEQLQRAEREAMANEITLLGGDVARVTKPSKYSKNDLAPWRALFELYLEAQIFYSTQERDHGVREAANARRQLDWFENEARKRQLTGQFQLPTSAAAYARFILLNRRMLRNFNFQEINRTAVTKILKKFDKRTSLGASQAFLAAGGSQRFMMVEGVAQDLCQQLSRDIVSLVPRLIDYMCPICFSIAWLPVRLRCRHVFCVRCVIKMQNAKRRHCPLCRGEVVLEATCDQLDPDLEKFLKKYFRAEVKEKQKANEIERGIELFGVHYKHSTCHIM